VVGVVWRWFGGWRRRDRPTRRQGGRRRMRRVGEQERVCSPAFFSVEPTINIPDLIYSSHALRRFMAYTHTLQHLLSLSLHYSCASASRPSYSYSSPAFSQIHLSLDIVHTWRPSGCQYNKHRSHFMRSSDEAFD